MMLIATFAAAALLLIPEPRDTVRVVITTDAGVIHAELYPDRAPATVANFLRYVEAGMYDGGNFFRVVRSDNQPADSIRIAVIQGGMRPEADPFEPILLERTSHTSLRHLDGTLSMARSGPDTATHSFFICIGDQPELDYGGRRNPDGQGFAAFGRIVSGMDVVRRINAGPAEGQTLIRPVPIRSMRTQS